MALSSTWTAEKISVGQQHEARSYGRRPCEIHLTSADAKYILRWGDDDEDDGWTEAEPALADADDPETKKEKENTYHTKNEVESF